MARYIKNYGRYLLVLAPLALLALLIAGEQPGASAATYATPFWSNTSSSPECAGCSTCGCPRPAEWSPEGVSHRTGELVLDFPLFSTPGMLGDTTFSLRWRSEISGMSQMGLGMLPSWEHSVVKTIINQGNPEASGGHKVDWRRPDGLFVTFSWNGTAYSTTDCAIHDALTRVSGKYLLTSLQGHQRYFDVYGMPDRYVDRNGNETDFTYNSSYQLTALEDDRGGTYAIHHNSDGFLDYIDDPSGRRWNFNYDNYGNLNLITSPDTTCSPGGAVTTVYYDSSNRVTSIKDARGNTVNSYTYVGTTRQIDKATIDSNDVDFSYIAGRTDRTDRNGNVHRHHYTGADITKTDMWVAGAAKYATEYTYSGAVVVTTVYPRGNRVDMTYDGNDNITERRRKQCDVSGTHSTDLVTSWVYTSDFVTSTTDPEGNQTSYTRDSSGNVTKITYPTVTSPASQTAEKAFEYNAQGQVTKITDEEGKIVQNSYFATGANYGLLQKTEVDPAGLDLETTYTYDSQFNVATVTDPNANARSLEYDNVRRVTKTTAPSPLSYEVKFEYDCNGNLTKKEVQNVDKDGDEVTANPWFTTTYTYSSENQLLTTVGELTSSSTRTTTLAYDGNGNRIRVTKPEGNKDKWDYDGRGLVARFIRGETSSGASTTENTYDGNGNLTAFKDGRGNSTTHTYDLFDRRTRTTDPLGHYTEWAFDKNGRVTQFYRKDASNSELARRSSYFDERGRLWKTSDLRKDPSATYSDAVTKVERFRTGHVKVVTDANSSDTTTAYDNAWRRTTSTDSAGTVTSWTLDENGNATAWSVEEVDGSTTVTHDYQATYDALNRILARTEEDRVNSSNVSTFSFAYDSRSHRVWQTNAAGDPARWTFDAAGRLVMKETALTTGTTISDFTTAVKTEWTYDRNDRRTAHTDDAGNESTWTFDALDRETVMTYQDTKEIAFVYDAGSNVVKTTDAAGNVIDDTFDSLGRLTSRSVTRGTGFVGTTSETFTYDAMRRLTKAEDDDYKVEFTHAVTGLRSTVYEEKQSNIGGSAYPRTVKKTYDAVGNKVTELYPSGLDLDYTWSSLNQLSSLTDGVNTIASYTYAGSRVTGMTLQNGVTTSYSYTGFRSELQRLHHETSAPATIADRQYGFDANHDRTYARLGGSGSSGDGFAYDKARRLTTAWMGSVTPSAPSSVQYLEKIDFSMDDDGNRTSVVRTPYGQSPTTTTYTDNNLNQYTTAGGATQSHDANGNLTGDGTHTYEYNYKNLICRVKSGSNTVATYKYDALGRRVEKDVATGNDRRFIYSGAETVSVYDLSNNWQQDFVFGQVTDEVLMLEQPDALDHDSDSNTAELTRSFYHQDVLGSVLAITDMNESVVAEYRYDPYGAVTITRAGQAQSSDPLGQPWMYTGRYNDEESGLYYHRARYFSPVTGRFVARDPLGIVGGANLYQYAASAPTRRRDPFGLIDAGDVFAEGKKALVNKDENITLLNAVMGNLEEIRGNQPFYYIDDSDWDPDGSFSIRGTRSTTSTTVTETMWAQWKSECTCAVTDRGRRCNRITIDASWLVDTTTTTTTYTVVLRNWFWGSAPAETDWEEVWVMSVGGLAAGGAPGVLMGTGAVTEWLLPMPEKIEFLGRRIGSGTESSSSSSWRNFYYKRWIQRNVRCEMRGASSICGPNGLPNASEPPIPTEGSGPGTAPPGWPGK